MANASQYDATLAALNEEIAALKRDLASAMGQFKPAADQGAQAAKAMVGRLEEQVEQQPLLSVLIALAIGYVGGRLLSR